ncbi:MAG TPA: chemotaxis-specific protein-glutamate methyltransferase CheB [Coriobacteriia bacterium]
MAQRRIRVLIADDSLVAREMLAQILTSDPEIEIVGQAQDGHEATVMTASLKPDLVTMDIHMPKMDGLDAVAHIMAYTPVPILVVSSSVHGDTGVAFDALKCGALEVMKKPEPRDWEDLDRIGRDLIRRVKMLSRVKVITHIAGRKRVERGAAAELLSSRTHDGYALVAVGSSTGGPSALMTLLGGLPKDFPAPVVIAQHIAEGFIPGLVDWLAGGCKIKVMAAQHRESPKPGCAYLAPTGRNLEYDGRVMRFADPGKGQLYIPSADTLFSSVASSMRSAAIGVILTGMGADGAQGLKQMRDAGAATIAQDEQTSTVYGMPKAAADLGAAVEVLPIEGIAPEVVRLVTG